MNLNKGDMVFCISSEDKKAPHYKSPQVGILVEIIPGEFLLGEKDQVKVIIGSLMGGGEPITYDIDCCLPALVFSEKMKSLPEDPSLHQSHIWGPSDD